MKIVGTMLVRNEQWILGYSLRIAMKWCDEMTVVLHHCSDRSLDIVKEVGFSFPGRIHFATQSGDVWNEMDARNRAIAFARNRGATHIAICDADEFLAEPFVKDVRGLAGELAPGQILKTTMLNLRGDDFSRYHANGVWGNRTASLVWRDKSHIHYPADQFHHREPVGVSIAFPVPQPEQGILHAWGVTGRRLHARHRFYRIQERLKWPSKPLYEIEQMYEIAEHGIYWSPASSWEFASTDASWFDQGLMVHVDLNDKPWQDEWCDRMISLHGREHFAGLRVD